MWMESKMYEWKEGCVKEKKEGIKDRIKDERMG